MIRNDKSDIARVEEMARFWPADGPQGETYRCGLVLL
jgi:hypothetical protein